SAFPKSLGFLDSAVCLLPWRLLSCSRPSASHARFFSSSMASPATVVASEVPAVVPTEQCQSAPNSSCVARTLPLSISRTLTIGYPTGASALTSQASTNRSHTACAPADKRSVESNAALVILPKGRPRLFNHLVANGEDRR